MRVINLHHVVFLFTISLQISLVSSSDTRHWWRKWLTIRSLKIFSGTQRTLHEIEDWKYIVVCMLYDTKSWKKVDSLVKEQNRYCFWTLHFLGSPQTLDFTEQAIKSCWSQLQMWRQALSQLFSMLNVNTEIDDKEVSADNCYSYIL